MAFYIKIDSDTTFTLPTDINTQERIELCNKIIDDNPEYFSQSIAANRYGKGTASDKVCSRLNIMATYILNGESSDDKDGYTLLSNYKEERNKRTEITFSTIER